MNHRYRVQFTHPETQAWIRKNDQNNPGPSPLIDKNGVLTIYTGMDNIKWSYGLNTVRFPTYRGEVVQILSAYIDDLIITGTVRDYEEMEDTYRWFLAYMHLSTKGSSQASRDMGLNTDPITMWYPHRHWAFRLRPKALPTLHMATDLVAPTWSLQSSVYEGDPGAEAVTLKGALDGLKEIHAGIGYEEDNPFSSPTRGEYNKSYADAKAGKIADTFSDVMADPTSEFDKLIDSSVSGPAPPKVKKK